jgi:tetratricopeptide (TPR) repeat protein
MPDVGNVRALDKYVDEWWVGMTKKNDSPLYQIENYINNNQLNDAERAISAEIHGACREPSSLYAALAEVRNLQRDFDSAEQLANESLSKDPGNVQGKLQLAEAYFGKNEAESADKILTEIEPALAQDGRFHALKSKVLARQWNFASALESINEALRLSPDKGAYYVQQAELFLSGQDGDASDRNIYKAIDSAGQAKKINSKNPDAWRFLIRGILLLGNQKEFDKAVKSSRKALKNSPAVDVEVADILVLGGRYEQAENMLNKVIHAFPDYYPAYEVISSLYLKLKRWDDAVQAAYKAMGFQPYSLKAWKLAGVAFAGNKEWHLAMNWLYKAIVADPEDLRVAFDFARAAAELREYEVADDVYRQILAEQPENAGILSQYGNLLMDMGRDKEAVEAHRKAYRLNERSPQIQVNLAATLAAAGEFEEARALCLSLMESNPDLGEPYLQYTQITDTKNDSHFIERIKDQLNSSEEPANREALNYALAKIYEDRQEFSGSFSYLMEACTLHREQFVYAEDKTLRGFDLIKSIFTEERVREMSACGSESRQPFFVIGMPRSGTTLVEQILSSHPDVIGGGELRFIESVMYNHSALTDLPLTHSFSKLTCEQVPELALDYLSMLERIGPKDKHIVNKLPQNFMLLGLIVIMFPNARIVHLNRNPMATCFSCFKKRFTAGLEFTFNLEELGRYYLAYRDLMKYWHSIIPGRIYDIQYEALTDNFEDEVRKLIDYCDLEWNDACLSFHKNKRSVRTASLAQVRKPIYTDAINFWRNFEEELKPLADTLRTGNAI